MWVNNLWDSVCYDYIQGKFNVVGAKENEGDK